MITGEIQSGLAELNETLAEYLAVTSKSKADALEHQAQKLRWALYRGFRGIRARREDIFDEARKRRWRTIVRPVVRARVDQEFGKMRLAGIVRHKKVTIQGKRVALNKQALGVHRELMLRRRGVGYLGASWIFREWKRSKDPRMATFEARGRSGRLSRVEIATNQEDATIRITNFVTGIAEAEKDRRIVRNAVHAVNEDIQHYLLRKQISEIRRAARQGLRQAARGAR